MNVLKNKQLIWPNGIIPYELDENFSEFLIAKGKK
jgi:hypothetical protein